MVKKIEFIGTLTDQPSNQSNSQLLCFLFPVWYASGKVVINMEPKEILLELRARRGFSQEQLAEKVHVTRQAVSRWETGETVPNTETLKLLSKLFDVSINTLLGSPRQLICQCCGMPLEDANISQYQPGAGRRFQRGVLQVVLYRREICLHQPGGAAGFSGGPHGQ